MHLVVSQFTIVKRGLNTKAKRETSVLDYSAGGILFSPLSWRKREGSLLSLPDVCTDVLWGTYMQLCCSEHSRCLCGREAGWAASPVHSTCGACWLCESTSQAFVYMALDLPAVIHVPHPQSFNRFKLNIENKHLNVDLMLVNIEAASILFCTLNKQKSQHSLLSNAI